MIGKTLGHYEITDKLGQGGRAGTHPREVCDGYLRVCAAIVGALLLLGCSSSEEDRPGNVNTDQSAEDALGEARAEGEALAVSVLRILNTAAVTYFARNGRYPSLEELDEAGLVNLEDAADSQGPYEYSITETETGYEIVARSEEESWAHFYCDETGIIRSEIGRPANAESAPAN